MEARRDRKKKQLSYNLLNFLDVINNNKKKIAMLKILQERGEFDLAAVDDSKIILHVTFNNVRFTTNEAIAILEISFDYYEYTKGKDKRINVLHVTPIRIREIVDLTMRYKAIINEIDDSIIQYFIKHEYHEFWKNDLDYKSSDKQTMESTSCCMIDWLMSKVIELKVDYAKTAIHYNLLHILPNLLRRTKDLKQTDATSRTLLHLFFKRNNFDRQINWFTEYTRRYSIIIVKILLEKGLSVDAIDNNYETAIQLAIDCESHISLIKLLITHSTNIDQQNIQGETLFLRVIRKFTLSYGRRLYYHMQILLALRYKGANVDHRDKNDTNAVQIAVMAKCLQAIKFLNENSADLQVTTVDGRNLMHLLADDSNGLPFSYKICEDIFVYLLSNGVDKVNVTCSSGDKPIHVASIAANYPMVKILIEFGIDVNSLNEMNKKTPLHYAVENSIKIVEFLVNRGANVNAKDAIYHRHAISWAASSRSNHYQHDFLKLLCKTDCSQVNARDRYGRTALFFALDNPSSCLSGQILMEYGADINEPCVFNKKDGHRDLLIRHWIKLDTAELTCSRVYETWHINDKHIMLNRQQCLNEIQQLKCNYMDDGKSFYQWLHMEPNRRCRGVDIEKFTKLVVILNSSYKFNLYADVIIAYYRDALARKSLLKAAVEAWYEMTKVELPDYCVELILGYLNNADLIDMVGDDLIVNSIGD